MVWEAGPHWLTATVWEAGPHWLSAAVRGANPPHWLKETVLEGGFPQLFTDSSSLGGWSTLLAKRLAALEVSRPHWLTEEL